jgi:branched-chain amino acid transport system substrate-binding protein
VGTRSQQHSAWWTVVAAATLTLVGCSRGGSADITASPTAAVPEASTTVPQPGHATVPTGTSTGTPIGTSGRTSAGTFTTTDAASPWVVDPSTCPLPADVTAPITGVLKVVMAAPLTGGIAAAAFKPAVDGFRSSLEFANANHLLGALALSLQVVDDHFNPDRTEAVLQPAIDAGAQVVAASVGTETNLAVRFTLNEQCIPQLLAFSGSTQFGDVREYPWTTGALPTASDEVAVLGRLLGSQFPKGGTVGLYYADDEFGQAYATAMKVLAPTLGFDVVADQAVPAGAALPAADQVDAVAARRPDVVLAAPEALDCTYFVKQLAAQRRSAPGWQPLVLLASGCSPRSIMTLAGVSADGVYTTTALLDVDAPANAADPGVAAYRSFLAGKGLVGEASAAAEGWTVGESFVAIVAQAMQAPGGLSRASLIDAARTISFAPSLARPGIMFRTSGTADPFPLQSLQIVRWSAAAAGYADVGPVVTAFER